jgi:uncharacterized membrane protein YdcZ (DUF606 family)
MKYVYITAFGVIFTGLVGAIQALINPQNWASLKNICPTTWIGVVVGFLLLFGLAVFCLKQVRKIDNKDKEAQRQETKDMIIEAFKEEGLAKPPKPNENKDNAKK